MPRILVVEDEIIVRTCITMDFMQAGFGVTEADGADEALLKFIGDGGITTVFTDINMPGDHDGLWLAREIAQLRPDVQLILTSGRESPGASAMPEGSRFLPKPYDCRSVVALIKPA